MSADRRRGRGSDKRTDHGGPSSGDTAGRGGRGRRARRNRGGPTQGGGNKGGANRNRKGNNRRRRQEHLHDHDRFWGDPDALPEVEQDVRITDHPAAVPLSLGPPPLPGHEKISEHYFGVVYERAVSTAGALAAAGGLIDPESLLGDD